MNAPSIRKPLAAFWLLLLVGSFTVGWIKDARMKWERKQQAKPIEAQSAYTSDTAVTPAVTAVPGGMLTIGDGVPPHIEFKDAAGKLYRAEWKSK